MNRLVFRAGAYDRLRAELLRSPLETAAIILATPVPTGGGSWRLLVDQVELAPSEAYTRRTPDSIELHPDFLARVLKSARHGRKSVVLVHTHPFRGSTAPSPVDLAGEARLLPTIRQRVPSVPHGRLIVGIEGVHASIIADEPHTAEELRVLDVGINIECPSAAGKANEALAPGVASEDEGPYARQLLAFGYEGQRRLGSLRVGIVGLGGTGSIIAQQLSHLGVQDFLLIDPDTLEPSNLNRVVGTTQSDIGGLKVGIAGRAIRGIRPSARVEEIAESVLFNRVAKRLLNTDLFFCCTDTHGSRAVLTQLAYQYLLPGFDVGTQISASDDRITHITGRVQMLSPGLACLVCQSLLDPEQVRRDLLTEAQRQQDPYIVGGPIPAPSVISINSAAASLAVTMYLSAVAGIPVATRHQVLRYERGVVRSIANEPVQDCVVCSETGSLARGDAWPLPGRQE